MPVIKKPDDAPPPFGHGAQIVIGTGLAQQLRDWQRRKAASPTVDEQD